ncbi:MAG: hypothetical protein MUC79_15825 [Thiobacillaceae bacterium]|nr:hypothetical protein [Thiobacillaceae bacterium]
MLAGIGYTPILLSQGRKAPSMKTFLGSVLLLALAAVLWLTVALWSYGPLFAILVSGFLSGIAMTVIGSIAFFLDPDTGLPGSRFGEAHLRRRD